MYSHVSRSSGKKEMAYTSRVAGKLFKGTLTKNMSWFQVCILNEGAILSPRGQRSIILFMCKAEKCIVHKQIHSMSVVLKFHGGEEDWGKNLKRLLGG